MSKSGVIEARQGLDEAGITGRSEEASILMGADAEKLRPELFDKQISDFSIDSRSVNAGELFFSLSQEDYARAASMERLLTLINSYQMPLPVEPSPPLPVSTARVMMSGFGHWQIGYC